MKMRKRQLAAVLTVTLLLLSGCSRIRIDDTGNAALRYSSMAVKASACVGCGVCETRCPYNLPIREMLKDAAAKFGE